MTKDSSAETKKAKAESDLTPSGSALAAVGSPPKNATDEELVAHADKYAAAKLKARRG